MNIPGKDTLNTVRLLIAAHRTSSADLIENVTTVTNTYQILSTDVTVICNRATSFTVTLPAGTIGKILRIKNINTGIVTVSLSGDTIDGEASQLLYQWDCMDIQCRAAHTWSII